MNHYLIQLIAEFNHLIELHGATYATGDKLRKRVFAYGDDTAYLAVIHARDAYEALIEASIEPIADAIANHIYEHGRTNFGINDYVYATDVDALVNIKLNARYYADEVEVERYKAAGAIAHAPQPWNPWTAAGLD